MQLVKTDELVHSGGVTYDAYLLYDQPGKVCYSRTRVSAEGNAFYVTHHEAFLRHWKQVAHYHLRVLRDPDPAKGFYLQLRVERPFNAAPDVVELG